ncbi:MAG: phosphopantetheine-binding protein [Candidatus Shapirobacteria bacterium]
MREEILKKVVEIMVEQLRVNGEDVKEESCLRRDLHANEHDMAYIMNTVEEEFGVEILSSDIIDIETIEQMVDYIEQKLEEIA